jgi:hypothetical protein
MIGFSAGNNPIGDPLYSFNDSIVTAMTIFDKVTTPIGVAFRINIKNRLQLLGLSLY